MMPDTRCYCRRRRHYASRAFQRCCYMLDDICCYGVARYALWRVMLPARDADMKYAIRYIKICAILYERIHDILLATPPSTYAIAYIHCCLFCHATILIRPCCAMFVALPASARYAGCHDIDVIDIVTRWIAVAGARALPDTRY